MARSTWSSLTVILHLSGRLTIDQIFWKEVSRVIVDEITAGADDWPQLVCHEVLVDHIGVQQLIARFDAAVGLTEVGDIDVVPVGQRLPESATNACLSGGRSARYQEVGPLSRHRKSVCGLYLLTALEHYSNNAVKTVLQY